MTDAYELTWLRQPEPDPPVSRLRAVVVGVAALLLGAPAGLLWGRTAPVLEVTFSGAQPGLGAFDQGVFFGADGRFLVVTMLAGLLCGLGAWWYGHGHGAAVPWALAAGGLGAARVAQAVGERVVSDPRLRDYCGRVVDDGICALYDGTPELRSAGLVVAWAVAALASFSAATVAAERAVR